MKTLNISDLSFSYGAEPDKPDVFCHSSISVDDSRIVGLVGVNGSGKSTLLKLIKGELLAQEGTIDICGNPIGKRSNVAFITQQAIDNIFPTMTVFENFMLFHGKKLSFLGKYDTSVYREKCRESLSIADMNLEDRLDEQVRFLSGGQQQALGIILACDAESPILLMDEPTASLDVFVAEKILQVATSEIIKKKGFLIFTSHNLHDILKYTETIVILNRGGEMKAFDNRAGNLDIIDLRNLMLR